MWPPMNGGYAITFWFRRLSGIGDSEILDSRGVVTIFSDQENLVRIFSDDHAGVQGFVLVIPRPILVTVKVYPYAE